MCLRLNSSILKLSKHSVISQSVRSRFNQPISSDELARAAGIASMFRLPVVNNANGLDACFVGVPIDHGTSNRSGTRFGPRQIRTDSIFVRSFNTTTGASPYSSMQVADIGDVPINPYNLVKCCQIISQRYSEIVENGCVPLSMGGDHTISYPILQAIGNKYGPVAMVHVDAHDDCANEMMGERIAHGTSFRRCVEEGLLQCNKVVQIGIRGSGYSSDEYKFPIDQGFRIVPANECWHKSLTPLMDEVRKLIGPNTPVYLSFDIDGLDPAFAPGTGTPEIGGLTSMQGLEIIRGCKGLNIVGCDLVEVSPPYDPTGITSLLAANLLFEMLCILPKVEYKVPALQ